MTLGPLVNVLTSKPLTGSNYLEWKRNLEAVLVAGEYIDVLALPAPPTLTERSSQKDRDDHKKWHEANDKVREIAMSSLSAGMQYMVGHLITVSSMIETLEDIFDDDKMPNIKLDSAAVKVAEKQLGCTLTLNDVEERIRNNRKQRALLSGSKRDAEIMGAGNDIKPKGNVKATGGVKKGKWKGRCFNCNKMGHWKADCPLKKKNGGVSAEKGAE